jgi:DNA (cytosine-5)-methyltransferase 1
LPGTIINKLYSNYKSDIPNNFSEFESDKTYAINTVRDAISDIPYEYDAPESQLFHNHTGSSFKVKINGMVGHRETKWDSVSPTIMGRGSGTGGPVIIPHPLLHRRMSIREVARIQTFPDDFVFHGAASACYRQIGNAVPVLMAYHIAKVFPKNL